MRDQLTFSDWAVRDGDWCLYCEGVKPNERSVRISNEHTWYISRHRSCLLNECHTGTEGQLDARVLHRDLLNTFGKSSASLEHVAKHLARAFPRCEISVGDPAERALERVRSCFSEVHAASGRISGWCTACGVARWGEPMVKFGVRSSRLSLFYHHSCLLRTCGDDGSARPLQMFDLSAAWAAMTEGPSPAWTVERLPEEEHARSMLNELFPGRFVKSGGSVPATDGATVAPSTGAMHSSVETNSGSDRHPASVDDVVQRLVIAMTSVQNRLDRLEARVAEGAPTPCP